MGRDAVGRGCSGKGAVGRDAMGRGAVGREMKWVWRQGVIYFVKVV